jgi:hypothetical protein
MVDGMEGRSSDRRTIVQPELQFFCKIALALALALALGLGHNPTLSHRSVLDT